MITAVGDAMRACYARGWITTRDGNASVRRGKSKFLHITPSACRDDEFIAASERRLILDLSGTKEVSA